VHRAQKECHTQVLILSSRPELLGVPQNIPFWFVPELTAWYWVVGEQLWRNFRAGCVLVAGRSRDMAVDWQENPWSTSLIMVIVVMLIIIITNVAVRHSMIMWPNYRSEALFPYPRRIHLPSISTLTPFALPHHSAALITCSCSFSQICGNRTFV